MSLLFKTLFGPHLSATLLVFGRCSRSAFFVGAFGHNVGLCKCVGECMYAWDGLGVCHPFYVCRPMYGVCVFGRPFVKRYALCYRSVVCPACLSVLSVCDVRALWPNGWMDQDETWHDGRPQPRRLCVRWGRSPLLPKRRRSPGAQPPIFGLCLL